MCKYFSLVFLLFCSTLSASYLSPDEIDTFYLQGYCIKKGAFSEEEINVMEEKSSLLLQRVLTELNKDKYPVLETNQTIYMDGTQIVFSKNEGKSPSIKRMVGCGSIEPNFMHILRSKKMVDTYFSLLEADVIEQLVCQFHPKLPGDGTSFIKHRDVQYRKLFDPEWEDVGMNGSYAVCIIAIDPMSKENGGLMIDKKGFCFEAGSEIEALTLEPGDMLFMHPEILHWSEANFSQISRRILIAGYCVYGANHKNYPGDCTNDVITKDSYLVEDAPWKKIGDTNF